MATNKMNFPKYYKDVYDVYSKYYIVDGELREDVYLDEGLIANDIVFVPETFDTAMEEDWYKVKESLRVDGRGWKEIKEEEWEWICIK